MGKLSAIRTLIICDDFVLVTNKGEHLCTPKFGHKEFWIKVNDRFIHLRRQADAMNNIYMKEKK